MGPEGREGGGGRGRGESRTQTEETAPVAGVFDTARPQRRQAEQTDLMLPAVFRRSPRAISTIAFRMVHLKSLT